MIGWKNTNSLCKKKYFLFFSTNFDKALERSKDDAELTSRILTRKQAVLKKKKKYDSKGKKLFSQVFSKGIYEDKPDVERFDLGKWEDNYNRKTFMERVEDFLGPLFCCKKKKNINEDIKAKN